MPPQFSFFSKEDPSHEAQGKPHSPFSPTGHDYDPGEDFVMLDEEAHDAEWVRSAATPFFENEQWGSEKISRR